MQGWNLVFKGFGLGLLIHRFWGHSGFFFFIKIIFFISLKAFWFGQDLIKFTKLWVYPLKQGSFAKSILKLVQIEIQSRLVSKLICENKPSLIFMIKNKLLIKDRCFEKKIKNSHKLV